MSIAEVFEWMNDRGWGYDNGWSHRDLYWDAYAGPVYGSGNFLVALSHERGTVVVHYEGMDDREIWSGQVMNRADFEDLMDYLDQYDVRYRAEHGLQSRAEYEGERLRGWLAEIERYIGESDAGADQSSGQPESTPQDSNDFIPPPSPEEAAAMMAERLKQELAREMAGRTDLLPPWRRYPEIPRYSLGWRMGLGETYLWVWEEWSESMNRAELLEYFRRYSPLPVEWLDWVAFRCGFEDAFDDMAAGTGDFEGIRWLEQHGMASFADFRSWYDKSYWSRSC